MHLDKTVQFFIKFADFICEINTSRFWLKYFYKNFENTSLILLPHNKKKAVTPSAQLHITTPKEKNTSQSFLSLKIKATDFYLTLQGDEYFFLPLVRNLVQKLFTHVFYLNDGLVLHGSSVVYKKKAYIFLGHSGAGKSTIAKLSKRYYSLPILADNQVFIKAINNKYFLYPFPFGNNIFDQQKTESKLPINSVYFLKKGRTHKLKILDTPTKFVFFKKHAQVHVPQIHVANTKHYQDFNQRLFKFINHVKMYEITFAKKKGFWEKINEA